MTAPVVELRFNPTGIRPSDITTAGPFLGGPGDAIEAALAVARAAVVDQMRTELRGLAEPTHDQILRLADLAWQAVAWKYRKISAPIMADAYIHAYRNAQAGDVPMSIIYDLAEKHAEKTGDYFHTSSRDALLEGFNLSVNRRIPAKAAADRVLDAYGLTPRQMRTYVAASQFNTPVSDVMPRSIKAKARAYIDKAFTGRIRKLSRQEEHNIDQQAQQFAWMWLQSKGRLSDRAEKLWITAKDERVCKICGPLHNKRVKVTERFVTAQGEFWTPGLHPNCRCVIRLLEHTFGKADAWDPDEHPRGGDPENKGRFSRARAQAKPYAEPPPTLLLPNLDLPIAEEEEKVSMRGTATDEGKVSMTSGRVSMGGGGRKVSMTDKVSMTGSAGKVSMTSEGKKVSMERQDKVGMLVTPEMRVKMDAALDRLVSMGEAKARELPGPQPRTLYSKDVIRIQDDNGHQFPVYAAIPRNYSLNWEKGKVELYHEIVFSSNLSHIRAQAYDDFEQQIWDTYDSVTDTKAHHLHRYDNEGRRWVATIEETDVMDAVRFAAYRGRVHPSETVQNDLDVEIEWEDGHGNRQMTHKKLSSVGSMLGVDPDEFGVLLLRMDEGHDSASGQTTQAQAGTKAGYENWVTSGVYRTIPLASEDVGHGLTQTMYQIEPDVEEKESIAWNVDWG